jgi:pre-mRNA cleavage complex 2 protein Pcf11
MSLPAAEVAADFRDALQDLRMNSRPEISNLTLIAKENTEYAEAISTELEKHIRSVSPGYRRIDMFCSSSSLLPTLFAQYAGD